LAAEIPDILGSFFNGKLPDRVGTVVTRPRDAGIDKVKLIKRREVD
jgi:hypothetical protein